ncbi:hypothetical protein ATZ36_04965, partial [Candidatus Endomicrobiellum trichonymphae]
MTRIISVYIIFAFLLTSFTGCGKLKNSPVSGLNQLNNSNSSEINSQPEPSVPPEVDSQSETSSEVDAKDLMEKESWKEWTGRQWNDNKGKWIGSISVSVSA